MRKMHKLINKIFPTFSILILLLSCKENKTKYFLKSKDDKNTIYKVELLKKEIIITELSKKENIKKVNVYYKVGRDYVLRTSGRKPIVYFSLNSNQDFIKDDFSLLNDSIITGNSENNIFFTKRKSNNKPIEYSYYYDKDFFITKIIYHIGTKEIIYNKATH
nr:hypothetical protein [Elizabethkingia sp. ASV34]